MKSILINLALVASALILVHGKELSDCDNLSQSLASNNQTLVGFIQDNCPTKSLLRYIGYVNIALYTLDGAGPYEHYAIDHEKKDEQAIWVAQAEAQVSKYWTELAKMIFSSQVATGESIEYPSSDSIDHLLKEVDEDNQEFALTDHFTQYYYATHLAEDEGLIRLFNAEQNYLHPYYALST